MTDLFQHELKKTTHQTFREWDGPKGAVQDIHSRVAALLLCAICAMTDSVSAATPPTPDEVLSVLGIAATEVPRLLNGEILSYSITEPTDKALSNGVIMYVRTAPSRLIHVIRRGALWASDPDVLAYGEIPPDAGVGAFKRFTFTAGQTDDEVTKLLKVQAGSEFNFSPQEIASFQALARTLDSKRSIVVAKAVAQQYRTMLLQRVRAYQKAGLTGIAPYARGDATVTDAGAALRIFTDQDNLLKLFAPTLREALLRYPNPLPSSTTSHILWLNRWVQGRPTAILNHRLIQTFDHTGVVVQNEFYAGHSFNAGQLVIGSVSYKGGTLVAYTHRSSSDQVAGIGQSLKHALGREALKKAMIKRFERLKSSLAQG